MCAFVVSYWGMLNIERTHTVTVAEFAGQTAQTFSVSNSLAINLSPLWAKLGHLRSVTGVEGPWSDFHWPMAVLQGTYPSLECHKKSVAANPNETTSWKKSSGAWRDDTAVGCVGAQYWPHIPSQQRRQSSLAQCTGGCAYMITEWCCNQCFDVAILRI